MSHRPFLPFSNFCVQLRFFLFLIHFLSQKPEHCLIVSGMCGKLQPVQSLNIRPSLFLRKTGLPGQSGYGFIGQ